MKCVECGVIVYPIATCVMHAGPTGCRLRDTIVCQECYGSTSIPDPGRPPRYNIVEMGILAAQKHAGGPEKSVDPGDVRHVSSVDVSYQTESVVQDQDHQDGRSHSVGPKSAFVEQVRPHVPQEERLPCKDQWLQQGFM
jgi:hypothetical protein